MAKGTREIRRKIKSIKNTRQITKAMELVAASKMRRAVANTLAIRPYARLAQALLQNLSEKLGPEQKNGDEKVETRHVAFPHALLATRPVKKVLVIAMSSDRGLCGGLNTQLFRAIAQYLSAERTKNAPPEISFVAVGKKAQDFLRRTGEKVIAAYPAMSAHPTLKDTFPISRMILKDYSEAAYDKVVLIYTDFISVINQKPMVRRLLPMSQAALEEMIEGLESSSRLTSRQTPDAASEHASFAEYKFEPSPKRVLEMLLPRLTEMQVYQSVLEAAASEHAARMFAMRNATDSASDIISELTLSYNQIRQASITAELAEISAGRAALG